MQSINTSLLSCIALILLLAGYLGFGLQVRFRQTMGAFMIIVGAVSMYITLSGSMESEISSS